MFLGDDLADSTKIEIANSVRRQLNESAKFWYQCIDEYQKPEDFVATLNALIQSLRNLTFLIQSYKSDVSGLEGWYEDKRAALKAHWALNWIVQSRNRIVKQGGLKSKSNLSISVVNWNESLLLEDEVDPTVTLRDVAILTSRALCRLYGKGLEDLFVVRVSREWKIEEFPDQEVLGVVAVCYTHLKELVLEFETMLRVDSALLMPFREADNFLRDQIVPEHARIATIELSKGELIELERQKIEIDSEDIPDFSEIAVLKEAKEKLASATDVFHQMESFKSIALHILERTGEHHPEAFLYDQKGLVKRIAFEVVNKASFYTVMRELAQIVRESRFTSILFILDMNVKSRETLSKTGECLALIALKRTGEFFSIAVYYRLSNGTLEVASEEKSTDSSGHNWLRPIKNAWKVS